MIPESGDPNREVLVNETFHMQTDDELNEKELKQIEADDQAIQTILLGLPEDIYAAVDSCETTQEIWFTSNDGESIESYYHRFLKLMNDLKRNKHFPEKISINLKFLKNLQPEWSRHVTIVHQTKDLHTADYTQLYDFLKYNQKEVEDLKAGGLARTQDPLALMATSNNPYTFPVLHQDQPMLNLKDITDPTTAMNMALALIAKAFKLNYSTPTNNNQRISSNPRNTQIAQPGNLNGYNDVQNVGNQGIQNTVQNPRIQNVGNQNGLIVVLGNANQNPNGNGNLVAAHTEGNVTGHNRNQIRCTTAEEWVILLETAQSDQGEGMLLIFRLNYLDENEEVNANCILMANLQQASTSGNQTDKARVYDSDGSIEVHNYENCYDNEIFNMFTQEEQYTKLLEPIPEPHQVPQSDNNVIYEVSSVEHSGGTVEQHHANIEETRVLYDSLYNNLVIEVEKVNTVNRKLRETNAELTTELARYKNQEKCFEISQEKYDKLETCYQKSVYQEQCLSKKINALHLNSGKQIMTLNEEISDLHKHLSMEKSTVSSLLEEKKKLKSDFKIHEYELLDKQIQLEKRIKELNTILVKTENENMELEFQVLNYAKENAHLKTTYKNLFDSISVTRTQTKMIIDSLQNKLHDTIYEKAKLRAQLFDTVFDQKDTSCGTSANTTFVKQSILGKPPKVIAPGMFKINPFKPSMEEKHVPNKDRASVRTKPITISQPPVITKKFVNSDSNGLSSTGVNSTKTRRPQPRSNTKNDRVSSASKSSCSKNKEVEVEEHHRKLLFSRNKKHMSTECNNVKLATQNVKTKVVCAMCKQCLNSVNHDVCLLNYVNGMNSRGKN
nr:hypothetical protein [Tanacetum cinerariifolium]